MDRTHLVMVGLARTVPPLWHHPPLPRAQQPAAWMATARGGAAVLAGGGGGVLLLLVGPRLCLSMSCLQQRLAG